MAYPTKPGSIYNYESFQGAQPNTPLPALQVTNDLAGLKSSSDETIDFLIQSFNPSGTLKAFAYPGADTLNEYVEDAQAAATASTASATAAAASATAADASADAAAASAATIVESIYDFGADGAGGATDLAALDAMLAALVAGLPELPAWARGPINVGLLIPGPSTVDPQPYLQKIYTAFDQDGLQGATFDYTNVRAWTFLVKPTTLGPQSQYLTPPRISTHRWFGAEWDFSAYTTTGVVVYFRRDGSLGTPLTVVGTVTKGDTSITVSSGGTTLKLGDRLLLGNTTVLDTLVGAFTLIDQFGERGAARGESVIVAGPAVAGVIPLASEVRDTYDSTATPLLYPYENEPEITLVNPTMRAPAAANNHRAVLIGQGRNTRIIGGRFTSFNGNAVSVFGSLGGCIDGVTIFSNRTPGDAGGGITIGGDTSAFLVQNNRTYGGSQMYMLTATDPFYGITRDVTFRDNAAYNPANGFSTHNVSECISYIDNYVYGSSASSYDIRCPKCVVRGNVAEKSASYALIYRLSPAGLVIDGFTARDCLSGIVQADFPTPLWDYIPDNITIRNVTLENIGGVGSSGAINCTYSPLATLGSIEVSNATVSMNDNTAAITVGGKYTRARLLGLRLRGAPGASPTGRSVVVDGAGNGAGNGPANPYVEVIESSTFAVPSVTDFTGQASVETAVGGRTSSKISILTSSSTLSERTLIAEQGKTARNNGIFSNQGTTAEVEIFLPTASSPRFTEYEFLVADADGFKIIAGTGDTIQIGGGSPGATGGSISSNPAGTAVIGSWVVIRAFTSTKWVATVDSASNWTVA